MYYWGYRQSLQSNSDSVTLFESTIGLCRLVVLEALSCTYVFHHVEALPMHSIVYTIVYYLWCRTEERGAWDACSYTDYLCILQCRRYVCRVRVILVLILKSVFFIYKTAFKLLRCLVYIKAKNYVVHQSSFSHLHHARWTFFLALVWYLHGHVICL